MMKRKTLFEKTERPLFISEFFTVYRDKKGFATKVVIHNTQFDYAIKSFVEGLSKCNSDTIWIMPDNKKPI